MLFDFTISCGAHSSIGAKKNPYFRGRKEVLFSCQLTMHGTRVMSDKSRDKDRVGYGKTTNHNGFHKFFYVID